MQEPKPRVWERGQSIVFTLSLALSLKGEGVLRHPLGGGGAEQLPGNNNIREEVSKPAPRRRFRY